MSSLKNILTSWSVDAQWKEGYSKLVNMTLSGENFNNIVVMLRSNYCNNSADILSYFNDLKYRERAEEIKGIIEDVSPLNQQNNDDYAAILDKYVDL